MKVSIITPVYNDPRVSEALKSIRKQEGVSSPEIIVVDGGSTDKTSEILENLRDNIDVLIREPDEGIYDAMNKGIQKASGDIIGVLNADDQYQDEYVLRDVLLKMEKTGAQTCYGDLVYVDNTDDVVRYWNSGPFNQRRVFYGWMPPHPTFFVKKEVYENHGLFDLDLQIAADYELMLRLLLKNNVSTTYIDRILVRMAVGGKSNESMLTIIKANWEVVKSWRKNDLKGGLLVGGIKPLRKVPQYVRKPARKVQRSG
ncbi:glycosyltransferase family 2 protein [Haladaptatus sp. CMSO5]|uniref:glycosyltransferase family 2 protein n=1 Tax=Haladaptatus sp. CMSO5 TaxID=3120514 RepID=UPI002FCE49FF